MNALNMFVKWQQMRTRAEEDTVSKWIIQSFVNFKSALSLSARTCSQAGLVPNESLIYGDSNEVCHSCRNDAIILEILS